MPVGQGDLEFALNVTAGALQPAAGGPDGPGPVFKTS
jgi:hypothetical protein